jgi:hypothetical protein
MFNILNTLEVFGHLSDSRFIMGSELLDAPLR